MELSQWYQSLNSMVKLVEKQFMRLTDFFDLLADL